MSENRYCRQPGAATVDAETYLTLLRSSRVHRDLVEEYHGKGERSIKQSAELVGLKLPEQPDVWPVIIYCLSFIARGLSL